MLRGRKLYKQEVVRIGQAKVKLRRKVTYLGVEIDRLGVMERHVIRGAALAKLRLGKLDPVLRLDSGVDLGTRLKIPRMIAQPMAFYGKELVVRRSDKAAFGRAQRVLIRRCLGAPWFVPNHLLLEATGVRDTVEAAEESKSKMVEAISGPDDRRVRLVAEMLE